MTKEEEMSAMEIKIMEVYNDLKEILSMKDLPPCVAGNTKQALACIWQAVNDLGLGFEQLYDYGI